jgi:hypothetical protein
MAYGIICEKIAYILELTLFSYIVQFVMSSDSMEPNSPNSAPEAPTDIFDTINKDDSKLPPTPEITYSVPILTATNNH